MTIVLHDSFLNAAQADLQSDKVLVKEEGLFSQTLYNLEQSLEKGSKALFSYYAVTHEKLSGEEVYKLLKEFGHNNLKAIPQIFCQIFNIDVSFLNNIHIINPKLAMDPNFPKLKNMSLEGISALRKRIDRTFSQTITEKKNLLKNYGAEVDKAYNGYVKYLDSIPSQAEQIIKEKKPDRGRHTNTSLRQVLCTNCLSISFNAN